MKSQKRAKPYNCVVLGMHRSGTSMIAGILRSLGINMGVRFREPDIHNESGYWEDLDWRDLNASILRAAGGSWYNPPDTKEIENVAESFNDQVISLVEKKKHSPWGIKDPRLCLTFPVIAKHLPDPLFILVYRNRNDILESLKKRAKLRGYYEQDDHWLNLIDTYINRITKYLRNDSSSMYLINYEHFIDDPYNQIMGLANTVGIKGTDIWEATKTIKVQ